MHQRYGTRTSCTKLVIVVCTLCFGMYGCVTSASRSAIQGDFSAVAEDTAGANYAELSVADHYNACAALTSLQRYSELDQCMPSLRVRVATETFALNPLYTYNQDHTELLLDSLEVEKHLALGDHDEAYQYAVSAYEASKRDPRLIMNAGLSAMTSILTLGMNNPNADDGYFTVQGKLFARIEPAGHLAVVEALRGNDAEAERYRQELHAIYDNANKSELDNAAILNTVRRWLGQSYFVAGMYDEAYLAFTRDDRSGLQQLSDNLFGAVLVAYTPVLEPMSLAVSGGSFHDIHFLTEFPLKVMLYRTAFKSGRLDEARAGYDTLLAEPRIRGFGHMHFWILYERGQIAQMQGDHAGARTFFERAIAVLEGQRAELKQESYKLGFVGDKNDIYVDMVSLLVAAGDFEEAFEYAERGKARAMVDMLATRQQFATDNPVAIGLLAELDDLEQRSVQLASLDEGATLRRSASFEDTRRTLQTEAPELASLVSVTKVATSDIQSRLGDDEVLVEYFGTADQLYAFVISPNSVAAVAFPKGRLASVVTRFRAGVQDHTSDAYLRPAKQLYSRIIAPIEHLLIGRRLTIVPHGPLHYTPFAALHDGDGFLIDRFELRLLPSASVLQYLEKDTAPTNQLLAFGNPDRGNPNQDLPGAEAETRAIDQGWEGSRILLREYASEASFKKFAGGFRYLHLASHGLFDPDAPLQSRVLLSPGDGEDGDLTVDELYGLRLTADLVTLSACDTGLGSIESGDDVIGLTRGFLYAGARSVVASLWPVSDEGTAYLMKRFYSKLQAMPKSRALREAVLETRKAFPHPIFWAAFQLTGTA